MQRFSQWPEHQARLVRWVLLVGWLLLILSLLLPAVQVPPPLTPGCPPGLLGCSLHHQPGNRLFWGVVVPMGVLMIVALSHELWRRICPLAFVSQLFRALGRQRTRPGKGGRPEVVKVSQDSWLGRHHIELQWSLLIAGLCLRLLVVNSSPIGLALLLILTLVAALSVGWAYGGKAWCQYVCPMAPVQAVLTGPRGPLGSTAHMGTPSRITQSMCRTIAESGKEQSACVVCQAPCLDIDSERAYWQTLQGRRGFSWAWYSYPGLVFAFFQLMEETVETSLQPAVAQGGVLSSLRSGLWAFDADLPGRALDPLAAAVPLPRLVAIPLLLVLAGWISVWGFQALERRLQGLLAAQGVREPQVVAINRARLLATFLAVNTFFWFVDPSQGALGPHGGQLLRSLVLAITAVWLFRGWGRDPELYRRESTSESLRRQLRDLPGLEQALDGRSLQELSPQEVFTLAKALPAVNQQRSREIYFNVLEDMLRSGRLDRGQLLLQLQDLRDSLSLEDGDHHEALRRLAAEHPDLLEGDRRQLQVQDLRREAVAESLQDLISTAGVEVLDPDALRPALRQSLERLRVSCGLEDQDWQEMLARYGPRGGLERERLEREQQDWIRQAGLAALLVAQSAAEPLLRPLALSMHAGLETRRIRLQPRLEAAGLEPLPAAVPAAGTLQEALDLLWQDPDPDTAGWVLLLERHRHPEQVERRLKQQRPLLDSSPFLTLQQQGGQSDLLEWLLPLDAASLFADLLPSGLVWLASQGGIRQWEPAAVVMREGATSDGLCLVIAGEARLQTRDGATVVLRPGETIGEMGVITGNPRNKTVVAGPAGMRSYELPAEVFEELLRRSQDFSRGLLRLMAQRLSFT